QRVRRGDRAEVVRIVHDGREEIHRGHESDVARDAIDRGVVAFLEPHEEARVALLRRERGEKLTQVLRTELRRSAGAARFLGEAKDVRAGHRVRTRTRAGW